MIKEGFSNAKNAKEITPFEGKYAVRGCDFFSILEDKYLSKLPATWYYRPLRIEVEINNRCNDKCKHCGMNAMPVHKGSRLTKDQVLLLRDAMIECKIPSVAITGGEPFLEFDMIKFFIEQFQGLIDVSKITSNGFWGKCPDKYLSALVDVGFLKNRLFVPLLMLSIGEQTTPLAYIANIINYVVNNYTNQELQIGISSLTEFDVPHKDKQLIDVYEKKFGNFPHDRVHGTYRNYIVPKGEQKRHGKTVRVWAEECFDCFSPTVGGYVLPTALLKFDGNLHSCSCFNAPKHLLLGNVWRSGLRFCLEEANSNNFIETFCRNGGLKSFLEKTDMAIQATIVQHYCDACSLLGESFFTRT